MAHITIEMAIPKHNVDGLKNDIERLPDYKWSPVT
jgi:hypothetical protein